MLATPSIPTASASCCSASFPPISPQPSITLSVACSICSRPDVSLQHAQQFICTQRRHAVAAKLSGTTPHTHTRWIASYRWVNGSGITPVDMFNASPGQSDPFLNIFIRQPIPSLGGHMEAIIDVRNLLAQGYVPVLGQDGQTVYLVQVRPLRPRRRRLHVLTLQPSPTS